MFEKAYNSIKLYLNKERRIENINNIEHPMNLK